MILFLILLLVPGLRSTLHASEDGSGEPAARRQGLVLLPIPFYTPETSGALSLVAVYHLYNDGSAAGRPSSLQAFTIYTLNDQKSLHLLPEIYLRQGRWRLNPEVRYKDWPDTFWGIGNDTPGAAEEEYTLESWRMRLGVRRQFGAMFAGVLAEFEESEVFPEAAGLLTAAAVAGSAGGTVAGLGGVIGWDSRDHIFYPRWGTFAELSALRYDEAIGSDFDFHRFSLDLRNYRSMGEGVLAWQTLVQLSRGEVPFEYLSQLGGMRMMRGLFEGRYRDRDLLAAQVEYRHFPWQRLGFAVFSAVGDVSDDLFAFDLDPKWSGGAGLRYRLSRDEPIHARLDVAFSREGSGVYFTLFEAF